MEDLGCAPNAKRTEDSDEDIISDAAEEEKDQLASLIGMISKMTNEG